MDRCSRQPAEPIALRCPMLECRRRALYQPSIHSKTAMAGDDATASGAVEQLAWQGWVCQELSARWKACPC